MGPNSKYISFFTLQKFIHKGPPKAHGHTEKHRIDLVPLLLSLAGDSIG